MQHVSRSAEQTHRIAVDLVRQLQPGDVVRLDGDLGAGKTHFTRGLVDGLGGDPRQVSSPTYTLLQVYETPTLPVFHLDAYRLSGPDDLEAIGFDELLGEGGVVVIEWPSRVADALPGGGWTVRIEHVGDTVRRLTIDRTGP